MNCPVWIPSAAMKSSVLFLKRYGSRKATLARGAPRPGSWMISLRKRSENGSRTVPPLSGGDVGIFKGAFYLHDPLDVPMAFSEVNTAEFGSTFSVLDVGFEYRPRTFSLSPDHTSHGVLKQSSLRQLPGWHVDTRFDSRSYKLPNRKLHISF